MNWWQEEPMQSDEAEFSALLLREEAEGKSGQRPKMRLVGGGGCPEQYDAFIGEEQVGYLRLRHGEFSVECPDCGGNLVYLASTAGDGAFEDDERDYFLRFAVDAIHRWVEIGRPEHAERQPKAPDVEYERIGKGWGEE